MKKLIIALVVLLGVGCSNSALENSNPKKVPYVEPKEGEKVSDVGEITKESFRPALDILFVIDNSGSMMDHQQRLAANISLFVDAISKAKFLDYHIGVTNSSGPSGGFFGGGTTECCGNLLGNPRVVDRATPNGIYLLQQNLMVGTDSGTNEMFFAPILWALDPAKLALENAGFLRDDAYLAIIIITDTEDQSGPGYDAQSTLNFLKQLKGSTDKIFVGGVYIEDSEVHANTCSGENGDILNKDQLSYFFQITNAMTFSLCAPDYGTKLAEIGKLLASKAQKMYLKQIPKKGTVTVSIGADVLPNDAKAGWTYNPQQNALEFGKDIDWAKYPDNTYPVVDFESLPVNWEEKK